VTNIPQGKVTSGDVKMAYTGPAPPKGKHRYVLTLWQQTPSDAPDRFADQHPIQVLESIHESINHFPAA
jgi:phosphatidylethanolamine-binding protein (PEBP) family uncharacterized protein